MANATAVVTDTTDPDMDVRYARGNVVTFGGVTWMYISDTIGSTEAPSDISTNWTQIGAAPLIPQESARLTATPSSTVTSGSGPTSTLLRFEVDSHFTITGINNLSSTDSLVDLPDTFMMVSGQVMTGEVTNIERVSPRNIVFTAQIAATLGGVAQAPAPVRATFEVSLAPAPVPDWFTFTGTAAPANIAAMTTQGNFVSGNTTTFANSAITGTMAYIALPTRVGGYLFRDGFSSTFLSNPVVTAGFDTVTDGAVTTTYDLYTISTNDFTTNSGSLSVEVTNG